MTKRMTIMLIVVGLILGGVFGFMIFRGMMIKKYMTSMGVPVSTVSATKAESLPWQPRREAVGSLRAVRGVDISSEVAGIVDEIHFESGADVKEGALLVKLRAADNEAQLATFQAAAKLAETNYERDRKQLAVQAVAQATVDTAQAALSGARAQVAEQQAILNKKLIKAPFSGHLGVRSVDVGQYINAGVSLVTLQNLDSLYFDFHLPQQALSELKIGQKIELRNDTWPARVFSATLAVINPKVDPATRNVLARAEMENADHALLPGMYATAQIETGAPASYVTVPQTAVSYNPYGNTVFVVVDKDGKAADVPPPSEKKAAPADAKAAPPAAPTPPEGGPKLTAKQIFVTTGATRGDQVAILKGIEAGDTVVTSGQLKLQNGAPVTIDNDVTPSQDAAPAPKDN